MATPSIPQLDGQWLDGLQFCAQVYDLFERIRNGPDGPSRLRMRDTVVEKKLIEELLPICKYIQATYRPGRYLTIQWLSGNQQHDAQVRQTGAYADFLQLAQEGYLEVTCVVHPNDYLARELLDEGGVAFGVEGIARDKKTREISSEVVGRCNLDFIDAACTLILDRIAKKAALTYPAQTALIVQCTLNSPIYMPDEWDLLMNKVLQGLPSHDFQEIFIYDEVSDYSRRFWGKGISGV